MSAPCWYTTSIARATPGPRRDSEGLADKRGKRAYVEAAGTVSRRLQNAYDAGRMPGIPR